MEGYFAQVVETLTGAGYRWYETANFCRTEDARGRDLRSRHNLAYWLGRDYLGLGIGAVSTVAGLRWRNRPSMRAYLDALTAAETPPRDLEPLPAQVQLEERVILGLRLDEPLALAGVRSALDAAAVERLERLGLVVRGEGGDDDEPTLALTERGRFLGGGVTAALLA
jgi:oxygen-independent coproporphyrinogen-3 oxidase